MKHGMGCVDSCLDTWECIEGLDASEVFTVTLLLALLLNNTMEYGCF